MEFAINDVVLNGGVLNGGELPSLPATVESLCLTAEAVWEIDLEATLAEC